MEVIRRRTCITSGSLTAYAFRTNPKYELTQFGAGLYSAGNALAMLLLMKLFFFRNQRASDLAVSVLATLLFSLYLVYDTYRCATICYAMISHGAIPFDVYDLIPYDGT